MDFAVSAREHAVLLLLVQALGPSGPYFGLSCVAGLATVCIARAALSGLFNWRLVSVLAQRHGGVHGGILVKHGASSGARGTKSLFG